MYHLIFACGAPARYNNNEDTAKWLCRIVYDSVIPVIRDNCRPLRPNTGRRINYVVPWFENYSRG